MLYILKKYKKLNLLFKFGINGVLLALIWFLFYQFFRFNPQIDIFYNFISDSLTSFLLFLSKLVFTILGIESEIVGKVIRVTGTAGVHLDKGCLGRNLLGLFAGFIIAYPGKIVHKLWFIPVGILVINFINVARICGLAYLVVCCPQSVDFNHHFAFKYTAYFFIFLMWIFWIKKFSNTNQPVRKTNSSENNVKKKISH